MEAAIAVSAIITGECDNTSCQGLLVLFVFQRMALRRTMLAQHPAGPPLRCRQCTADLLDRLAATGGVQKVSFDRRKHCRAAAQWMYLSNRNIFVIRHGNRSLGIEIANHHRGDRVRDVAIDQDVEAGR
jgi:hypothetical protein